MKKVPVYDQHLVKPDNEPNLFKTSEENYVSMFLSASSSVSSYLMKKIVIKNSILAEILSVYIEAFKKIKKGR